MEREAAAARDAEIDELISKARYLTLEVKEFVEAMRNTVLNGKTREDGQRLCEEASQCVKEILMLKGVNLQTALTPLRQARSALRQLCANSDNITAPAIAPAAVAAPNAPSGNSDGGGSGRRQVPSDAFATIA